MVFDKLNNLAGNLGIDLNNIKLDEIITDKFIKDNTTLDSVKSFIEKSGFDVSSILDFKNLPVDKIDAFVKSVSGFGSWQDLLAKAAGGKIGGLFK